MTRQSVQARYAAGVRAGTTLPRVLYLVAPLAVVAALLLQACGADPRPSIVLVTLDTTRPDHLTRSETPNGIFCT